ncbi:MAG: ABC transporter ATP-binding protein, partial [Alphaproteobacteria bacterium]
MRRLIPFHRGSRAALAGLVLIGAAQAAASVLMMGALDAVLSAGEAQRSAWPLVLLAAATAGLTLGRYAERVQGEVLGQGIVHAIRGSLSHHLIGLPPRDGLPARGEILLRFVGDLSAIRNWHVRGVPALVVGLPVLIGGSISLGLTDWRLGAAVLVPVLVTVAVQGLAAPHLRRAADEARRRRARLAGEITHACDVISSIQSFGRSGKVERALQRRSEALATALIDRARWSGAIRAGAELGAAGMPLCIAAVWATVPGIGAPAAASALVFGAILAPRLRELGRAREYLDLARVADRRIAAFLARPVLDPRAGGPG